MNAERRAKIDKALKLTADAAQVLREAAEEEREQFDNMTEAQQQTAKGEAADSDASKLEEWADVLEDMDISSLSGGQA